MASYGMDAAALRTEISAALADDLGVYTLLNGETTPAISVRPEGQRLAAGTVASGLEVVILSEPRLSPVGAYLQQEAIREFIVFLVGWDDTAETTIAAEKLVYIFPGTIWQEIPIAKRIGPTNQARVIIQSPATPGLLPIAVPRTGASNVTFVIIGTATGSSGGAITGASALVLTLSGVTVGTVVIVGASDQVFAIIGSATGVIGSISIGSSSATLTIAGASSGAVRVAGTSAQALALTGSATAAVRVNGSSSQSMAISGASTGTVAITGISSRALAITGSAAGVIGAVVIGASTATLGITGSAIGSVRVAGGSSATLAIAGSAAGSVRVSGATTRALAISGAAAGAAAIAGASSQTLSITGSATGTAQDLGTGDYITTLSGDRLVTLSGDRLIILPVSGSIAGASTQTLALAGSATAAVRVAGSSSQVMALIGTSAGAVGAAGASSRVLAITGAIAGTVRVSGASARTLAITGAAAATVRVTGSSAQTLAITGSAAGTVTSSSSFPAPTMYLPLVDDLLDDSANGFTYTGTPTPTNITSTPPPIASSYYSFAWDGGDALIYADTALLNPGTGDFTISAFVRPTFVAGMDAYPAWFSKGAYQSSLGAMAAFRDRTSATRWGIGFSNPWRETPSAGATAPEATWVRLTFVRSGNTITLYQGTSVRGTVDATGLDLTSVHPFKVGGSLADDANNWSGGICDFVYIRGTALTIGQITDLQTNPYSALI
jgi:hypothetical protein